MMEMEDMVFDVGELGRLRYDRLDKFDELSGFCRSFLDDLRRVMSEGSSETFILTYKEDNGRFNGIYLPGLERYIDGLDELIYSDFDGVDGDSKLRVVLKYEIFRYLKDERPDVISDVSGRYVQITTVVKGIGRFRSEGILPLGNFRIGSDELNFLERFYI